VTAPKCILVVDDDETIRDLLDMTLSEEGYEVVAAPNGAAALELVRRARPDVILLDMKMPVLDGWQFARAYRAAPGPHAPVVVLTAAENAAQRAAEIKADGWIAKPFDLDELLRVIQQHAAPLHGLGSPQEREQLAPLRPASPSWPGSPPSG
jgi:two-component system, chemotaxis family, chemotaxis protein CheY